MTNSLILSLDVGYIGVNYKVCSDFLKKILTVGYIGVNYKVCSDFFYF